MTYTTAVLADSPILFWQMDETSGVAAADSSGNSRPGVYTNGLTVGASPLIPNEPSARGVTFNSIASDQSVARANEAALDLTGTTITVEGWFLVTGAGAGASPTLIGKDNTDASFSTRAWRLNFNIATGVITWSAFTTASTRFLVNYTLGAWTVPHHVVGTYDGTTARLYVDGVEVANQAWTGNLRTSTWSFRVGKDDVGSGKYAMLGSADGVALYGTALSAARVTAHYVAGGAVTPYDAAVMADTPALYWKLSDALGAAAVNSMVVDSSGNGRHGVTKIGTVTFGSAALVTGDAQTSASFPRVSGVRVQRDNSNTWETAQAWSVEAIIQPSSLPGDMTIGGINDNGTAYKFSLVTDSSGVVSFYWNGGGFKVISSPAGTIVAGTRYHVVGTVTAGGSGFLYVNGVQIGTAAAGTPISTNSVPEVQCGSYTNANGYAGLVARFAIYTTQLSPARIAVHATAMLGTALQVARVNADTLVRGTPDTRVARVAAHTLLNAPVDLRMARTAVWVLIGKPLATVRWWDGSALQPATVLGWWDGSAMQPAKPLGWWDGSTIQPLS